MKENEIVVIKGEKFILHQVRTGETIYSISRDFNIEKSLLLQHNQKISEGLDIGEILKIPYRDNISISQIPVYKKGDPIGFEIITINSRKETPYFIAKKYGVSVEEIYSYNPEVRKFKKGTKIRIPIWKSQPEDTPGALAKKQNDEVFQAKTQVHTVVSGETLYSISRKYQVSESEIIFHNPEAKNLKAGAKIYLPIKSPENSVASEVSEIKANNNYFEHVIESGEAMWGITRKYKVTEDQLMELNPVLRTGFPAGLVIKIPVQEILITQLKPVNEEAFLRHSVKKGETLFGLAAKYNLKVPEIKMYNPALEDRNLVIGENILIPQKPTEEIVQFVDENKTDSIELTKEFYKVELKIEIPESCVPMESSAFSNSTYDVALFLPLFLEANDTLNSATEFLELIDSMAQIDAVIAQDTSIEKEEPKELFKQFYGNSENFIQFYEGVLLAVDSMQNAGMQINLNVFDTQNSAESIRKFIYTENFLQTDLIIGPIYQSVQNEVAQIAAKNRIPIVSPLGANSVIINSNSQFYQINPSHDYINAKTAEMVAEEYFDSNFIIVRTAAYEGTSEGKLVELIQEKLFNSGFLSKRNGVSFTVYDFKNEGPFGLRRIMSHTKENVVYIPSNDEGELSFAISNVNNLADDYSITLIGSNRYANYQSIDVEHFHNLKLKYIAPYWIDYQNPVAFQFLEKFKTNFETEPNDFGVQGYDAAFYFLNALKYFGKDFEECLPYFHVNLVQGNYHFEKVSQFGGYMNQGVSVISYSRDYEVERKRVKGQPILVEEN